MGHRVHHGGVVAARLLSAEPADPVSGIGADTEIEVDPFDRYDDRFATVEHDYDPRDEYEIVYEHVDGDAHRFAQGIADGCLGEEVPFERVHVWPVSLPGDAVGMYCNGTYLEPVVLVDVDRIAEHVEDDADLLYEIRRTVEHEVAHAIQESEWDGEGDWADEGWAEAWRPGMASGEHADDGPSPSSDVSKPR